MASRNKHREAGSGSVTNVRMAVGRDSIPVAAIQRPVNFAATLFTAKRKRRLQRSFAR